MLFHFHDWRVRLVLLLHVQKYHRLEANTATDSIGLGICLAEHHAWLHAGLDASGDAMTIHRHDAKSDANQPEIVQAIRKAGWEAHIVRRPCDLFCWHPRHDIWAALEVKDPSKVRKDGKPIHDARMEEQAEFLDRTGTPVVTTPEEAILALARRIDRHLEQK